MKKVLAIALALVVLVSFAACTGDKKVTPYEGDLSELISAIYEKERPEFMVIEKDPEFPELTTIDLADPWAVNGYLGLGNPEEAEAATDGDVYSSGIKEAYFSEPMMMAQAYSLVVARVEDTSKIEEIKAEMFEGINLRKWVCVGADQLRVVSYADIIMLVMVSSDLAPGLADKLVQAFAETVSGGQVTGGDALGALTGEILTLG